MARFRGARRAAEIPLGDTNWSLFITLARVLEQTREFYSALSLPSNSKSHWRSKEMYKLLTLVLILRTIVYRRFPQVKEQESLYISRYLKIKLRSYFAPMFSNRMAKSRDARRDQSFVSSSPIFYPMRRAPQRKYRENYDLNERPNPAAFPAAEPFESRISSIRKRNHFYGVNKSSHFTSLRAGQELKVARGREWSQQEWAARKRKALSGWISM